MDSTSTPPRLRRANISRRFRQDQPKLHLHRQRAGRVHVSLQREPDSEPYRERYVRDDDRRSEGGWPHAHEVTIRRGECSGDPDKKGLVPGDSKRMMDERPDFVVFNGKIEQYVDHPIQIKVGELVRVFCECRPEPAFDLPCDRDDFQQRVPERESRQRVHLQSFEVGPGNSAIFRIPRARTGRLSIRRSRDRARVQGCDRHLPRCPLAKRACTIGSDFVDCDGCSGRVDPVVHAGSFPLESRGNSHDPVHVGGPRGAYD